MRSSLVHLLCNEKRLEDALPLLAECEGYARADKTSEDGELFQAALEAGIHYSLETNDEDGVIGRIRDLDEFATSSQLADRIGGDLLNVANHSSHRKMHRTALAAAEAAIRLGRRCFDPSSPSFLVGALYAEAMVIAQAGDDQKALPKAEAILDLCKNPADEPIKQAVHHLIAEIRRTSGDSQTAVEMARRALRVARGDPENIAFAKASLAVALNDDGQTEEALQQVKEAWSLASGAGVPPLGLMDILAQISNYASQLGAAEDLAEAVAAIDEVPAERGEVEEIKTRAVARAGANRVLRERLLEFLQEKAPSDVAGTSGTDHWGHGSFQVKWQGAGPVGFRFALRPSSCPQEFGLRLAGRRVGNSKIPASL